MTRVVRKVLAPVLQRISPIVAEAVRRHGPEAVDSLIQSLLRGPQQRAWRACASAAVTGLTSTHGKVSAEEIASICDLAARIADEMVKRDSERAPEVEEEG